MLGMDIQKYAGLQLAMSEVGLEGNRALMPLMRMNMQLQQMQTSLDAGKVPTGRFADGLREIGLSATDAHGKVLPLETLFPQIADHFKAMADHAKATGTEFNASGVAMQLFGVRGAQLIPMLLQGSAAINEATQRTKEFGVPIEKQVELWQQWEKASADAKAALQAALTAIGADLAPAITALANVIERAVAAFDKLPGPIKDMLVTVPLLAGGIALIVGAFIKVGPAIEAVTGVLGGPWILAIAAAVAAIVLLINHWKQIEGALQPALKVLQDIGRVLAVDFAEPILTAIGHLKNLAQTFMNDIHPALIRAGDAFKTFMDYLDNHIPASLAAVAGHISDLVHFFEQLPGPVKVALAAIAGPIPELIMLFTNWKKIWEDIRGPAEAFVKLVKDVASTIGDQLKPVLDDINDTFNTIKKMFEDNSGTMKDLQATWKDFQSAVDALKETLHDLQPVLDWMKLVWGDIARALGETLLEAITLAMGMLRSLAEFLHGFLPAAIRAAIDFIHLLVDDFKLIADTVRGVVQILTDIIHGDWRKAWSDAEKLTQTLSDDVIAIWTDLVNGILQLVAGMARGVIDGMLGMAQGVVGTLNELSQKISGHKIIPDEALGNFKTTVDNFIGTAHVGGAGILHGLHLGLAEGTPAVVQQAHDTAQQVGDALGGDPGGGGGGASPAKAAGQKAGKDMVDGLVEMTPEIVAAVQALADAAGATGPIGAGDAVTSTYFTEMVNGLSAIGTGGDNLQATS